MLTILHSFFPPIRLMKLSSINLNYIIATGAVIFYITMYIYVIGPKDKVAITFLCNVSYSYCMNITITLTCKGAE